MVELNTEEIVDMVDQHELVYAPRNDAVAAEVNANELVVTTRDGRVIHTPLAWFPFLMNASEAQRQNFRVMGTLILWDELEDVVTMEVILLGRAGT